MVFLFIKMQTKITTAATLALFLIVLMPKIEVLGNFSDSIIGHMLPAYAIAAKSYILGESSKCRGELERFKEGVDGRKVWSLRMLDSSGSPKPGFIYGNNYWTGSRTQCYDTLNPEPLALHPKWLENNTLYRNPEEELAPYQLNYFAAQFLHNSTLQYHHRLANEHIMTLGLCLPATCDTKELSMILEKVFEERTLSIGQVYDMDFKLLHVKNLKDDPQYLINWRMIIVISVIIITLLLMTVGTCCDIFFIHKKILKINKLNDANNNDRGQDILETKYNIENGQLENCASQSKNHQSKFNQVLVCFSVYTNTKNLFETSVSEGSVASIHGLRFLGMVWIIMIHAILYGQDFADNRTWSWRMSMDFPTQIISNGTLSVDTYFFLSGFLLSHIFFKSIRNKGDEVIQKDNHPKGFKWGKLCEAMVKRFVRLTPAYMMIVGIVEMNASFYSQTSQFYMTERPHETCSKYWWRNLLYINNFFSRDEMCLSWSWYLSNDTQFFIFGTFLLLMSVKFFYTAVGVLIVTLFTSSIISGYLAYIRGYVPTLDEQWNTLDIFYDPPWVRIGPYIIGLVTAYLLCKMGNRLDVKKQTLCFLWICGSICNLSVLFGLYNRTIFFFPISMYMALSRIVWGIGIAWIVIACCTKHGGIVNTILTFKGWVPLSKLTYCAYLLNPFLISSVYMSSESSFHVDFLPNGTFFLGYLMMTYFCAYATYLMFEVPYILLLKLYYNSGNKSAQQAGTIFIQSTISTSSIEEIAVAAPNAIKWFQLYVYTDRDVSLDLIKRVVNCGFQALVLTVDTPFFGVRRADVRNKFVLPKHLTLANFDGHLSNKINQSHGGSGLNEYVISLFDDSLEWEDLQWIKSVIRLPIILKGILTAEDAILGVKYGASGIIVSNHGARQIDGTAATIEALPEVVKAVDGRIEVYLDGGIRTGTDVFTALALGAKMVFFGRPMIWGLTHGGEKGATAVLQLMKKDIRETLALAGCRSVKEVTEEMR